MDLRLRPRYERLVAASPSQVLAHLRALERSDAACPARVYADHALVYTPPAERRLWSPFLTLDVRPHEAGTRLLGRFSPMPSVWTLFAASYAICAFSAFFAAMFAVSQAGLGQRPWALWVWPAAAAVALVTFAFARYGRRRGHGQMEAQRRAVEVALGLGPDA